MVLLFARCGLACGTARLGAPGWAGVNDGLFDHPGVDTTILGLRLCPRNRWSHRNRWLEDSDTLCNARSLVSPSPLTIAWRLYRPGS